MAEVKLDDPKTYSTRAEVATALTNAVNGIVDISHIYIGPLSKCELKAPTKLVVTQQMRDLATRLANEDTRLAL